MAKKINRGGVIPYQIDDEGNIKMLFMRPSDPAYGGSEWQIAKGKIELDDDDIEAGAFREAEEELGLFTPNTTNRKKIGMFLGRTTIYIAKVIDPSPSKFGDFTEETAGTRWMTPEEFKAEGRDLHKAIVKAAVRAINEPPT